jgi:ribosomal-protein-alanine N-acetyltransferase
VIRPGTDADLPALADLERRAAHAPWSAAALAQTLAAPTTRALLAGEPPVGHVVFTVVADEGEVLTIAVAPEARRSGVGRALLDEVHAAWRAAGVRTGWLEVRADNGPARALYAAAGWVDAGARRAYYADGVDAVVCRWSA